MGRKSELGRESIRKSGQARREEANSRLDILLVSSARRRESRRRELEVEGSSKWKKLKWAN